MFEIFKILPFSAVTALYLHLGRPHIITTNHRELVLSWIFHHNVSLEFNGFHKYGILLEQPNEPTMCPIQTHNLNCYWW